MKSSPPVSGGETGGSFNKCKIAFTSPLGEGGHGQMAEW